MAWDFSTDPECERKLEWMRGFVREQIWPLETLIDEPGWEGLQRAVRPLQEQVRAEGLWAAHLDPELATPRSSRWHGSPPTARSPTS